jgi:hypothetical protein
VRSDAAQRESHQCTRIDAAASGCASSTFELGGSEYHRSCAWASGGNSTRPLLAAGGGGPRSSQRMSTRALVAASRVAASAASDLLAWSTTATLVTSPLGGMAQSEDAILVSNGFTMAAWRARGWTVPLVLLLAPGRGLPLEDNSTLNYTVEPWDQTAVWLEPDTFAFEPPPPSCAQPREIACRLAPANTIGSLAYHFAHSAQSLLPCWSLFNAPEHRHLQPRLILDSPDLVSPSAWTAGLLGAIGVGNGSNGRIWARAPPPSACALVGTKRSRMNTGWPGDEVRWLSRPADSPQLLQSIARLNPAAMDTARLHATEMAAGAPRGAATPLHVGLLLRAGTRRFSHPEAIAGAIRRTLPGASLTYTTFKGFSFAEQAAWVHAQDLVVSAHGAQNMNFLFARRCAAFLEVYPLNYFIPGFYLPLVHAAGALPFIAYPGTDPKRQSYLTRRKPRFRRRARRVAIRIAGDDVARALLPMVRAREACLRAGERGAGGGGGAGRIADAAGRGTRLNGSDAKATPLANGVDRAAVSVPSTTSALPLRPRAGARA